MNAKKKKNIGIIIFIAVICFLFFIPPVRMKLASLSFSLLRPVLLFGAQGTSAIRTFGDFFVSYGALRDENESLKKENLHMISELAQNELLKNENESLKKAAHSFALVPQATFETRVLGSFTDPSGTNLILEGGKNQGVQGGSFVVTEDKIVVGRITNVYDNSSLAGLLRNVGTTMSVTIQPGNIEGLLVGRGNSIFIDLVPNSASIDAGSFVMTNAVGESAVPDLLIGEVLNSATSTSKAFKDIFLKELVSYRTLGPVFIIHR